MEKEYEELHWTYQPSSIKYKTYKVDQDFQINIAENRRSPVILLPFLKILK